MKVYVVLECFENHMYYDRSSLKYYDYINCTGIFMTLELAAASLKVDVNNLVQTNLNSDIINLYMGWKYNNGTHKFFIVKRKLIVK